MHVDVIDLSAFYRTGLGGLAANAVARNVETLWGDCTGQRVLGYGFTPPIFDQLNLGGAERVMAMMPAPQGVLGWPTGAPRQVALVEGSCLPLPDASVDRILVYHALEMTENSGRLLRELWRVLAPQGHLMAVVPNRRGPWARFEATPFGYGHPYTQPQLFQLMRNSLFQPIAARYSLFVPPVKWGALLNAAGGMEKIGARWFPRVGGLLMVDAVKQVYALSDKNGHRQRRRAPVLVPNPVPVPRSATSRSVEILDPRQ